MKISPAVSLSSLTITAALALSACGGASSSAPDAPAPDAGLYAELIAYCGASQPTALDASRDGWVTNMGQDASAIVSASGNSSEWQDPIVMKVNIQDLRGRSGNVILSGYGEPEWVMGVTIPTLLAAKSVACIKRVAKLTYPVSSSVGLGNIAGQVQGPTLSWQSYWNRAVPVDQLPGYRVDGFEFVSNFTPRDGQVYFTANKTSFPSAQNLSVCYLAPNTKQWDCSQPTISDQGKNWQVFVRGVKPGVYILNSSTLQ